VNRGKHLKVVFSTCGAERNGVQRGTAERRKASGVYGWQPRAGSQRLAPTTDLLGSQQQAVYRMPLQPCALSPPRHPHTLALLPSPGSSCRPSLAGRPRTAPARSSAALGRPAPALPPAQSPWPPRAPATWPSAAAPLQGRMAIRLERQLMLGGWQCPQHGAATLGPVQQPWDGTDGRCSHGSQRGMAALRPFCLAG